MDPRHLWLDASGRGVTGQAGGVLCVPCHDTNRYEIKHSHTDLAQASVAPPVSTRARSNVTLPVPSERARRAFQWSGTRRKNSLEGRCQLFFPF